MSVDKLRNKFFNQMEIELEKFVDKQTGLLKKETSEHVHCSLCNEDDYSNLFTKSGFTYVRCKSCGFVYVNPRLSDNAILEGYSDSDDAESNRIWKDVLLSKDQTVFNNDAFSFLLEKLENINPNKGKLLDVGCSIGHFMSIASDYGYDVEGIELEPEARSVAIKKGFKVSDNLLEKSNIESDFFDVVSLMGLIEHIPNPIEFMKEVRRILKHDGFVIFNGVPNINSLNNILLGSEARVFNGRNHLGYYTKKTFEFLLEETGFKVRYFGTYVPAVDSIVNKMQSLDPFEDVSYEYLDDIMVDLFENNRGVIEDLIIKYNLGYKIRAIVSKA